MTNPRSLPLLPCLEAALGWAGGPSSTAVRVAARAAARRRRGVNRPQARGGWRVYVACSVAIRQGW